MDSLDVFEHYRAWKGKAKRKNTGEVNNLFCFMTLLVVLMRE